MEMIKRNQTSNPIHESFIAEAEQRMAADGLDPKKANGFERGDYFKRLGIEYIKSDPGLFMRTYVMGVVHTFTSIDSSTFTRVLEIRMTQIPIKSYTNFITLIKDYVKKKGPAGLVIAGLVFPYLIVVYLGTVVGLLVAWKRYNTGALIWCLLIAGYVVAVTGVGGSARFKMPAVPFYLAFTGIGISYIVYRLSVYRSRRGKQ
jgi:hypothetical protein